MIRAYSPEDAEPIAKLFLASVVAIGPRDYSQEQVMAWASRAPTSDIVHARCTDGRTVLVAVDEKDRILAYIDLEQDGHIDHLYCLPEASGTGVASGLYDALEAQAYEANTKHLYTEASEAAFRLFLRKGFTVLHKRSFEINGVTIHNYAMQKQLG